MAQTTIAGTFITGDSVTASQIAANAITNAELATTAITSQTAETTIAGDDVVLIYDTSASAFRKMTRTNFVAGIGGGPTINGATENELVTVANNTANLDAEAELTYDGTDFKLMKGGASATGASLAIETYNDGGNPARLRLRASHNDTQGTMTSNIANYPLGFIQFEGVQSGAFQRSASIRGETSEAWDGSGRGSKLRFYTTPNNSNTERLIIEIPENGITTFTAGGDESIRLAHASGITWSLQSRSDSEFRVTDNNAGTTRLRVQAGTSGDTLVKDGGAYANVTRGIAKVWIRFSQTNSSHAMQENNGVASITDGGAAGYTDFTWSRAFASEHYAILISQEAMGIGYMESASEAAGGVTIRFSNIDGGYTDALHGSVACFGDLS